ncbi:nuclear pore complex protein Nup93-like [Oscarella lobularis]|uniref:nuclear pore complex protein Nup93-like n=1 Tax=Oscarella lobularis TaxID=121494 RepID=UPI0033137F3A
MADSLQELLESAKRLTADMGPVGDIPKVQRNISQIAAAGQRLWEKTGAPKTESADVRASILLGARGFDVPRLSQKLDSLSAVKSFEPLSAVRDTDIEGFLRNERENALLTAIESSRKAAFEEAERHHWQCIRSEWEEEKQQILSSLLGTGQDITLSLPGEHESFNPAPLSRQGRSSLNNVEIAYARQIFIRNENAMNGFQHSLVHELRDIAEKFNDKDIHDCWRLLAQMLEIQNLPSNPHLTGRQSEAVQMALLHEAKSFLEKRYRDFMMEMVSRNLLRAELGGKPGTFQLVKSYLKLKYPPDLQTGFEDGRVDGDDGPPVWPAIYYCMRCGDLDAAVQIAIKMRSTLGDFTNFMQEYARCMEKGERLPAPALNRIRTLYRKSIRTHPDPFKKAVYCVIGCCEPENNHSDVAVKTDDYMWIKLSQVQPNSEGLHAAKSEDHMSLAQLQSTLLEEYGELHFKAAQMPLLYFRVLLLSLQFEAALEFLSRVEQHRSHAVHFAIALHDAGVLNASESIQAPLLDRDDADEPRFNLAQLVVRYTHKFAATDPREALQYYYVLKEFKSPRGKADLFVQCVSELVLETREFETLLGRLESDGSRKPGCIDRFKVNVQEIIDVVATDAETNGLFEDAVRLYDLAHKHDETLRTLNGLLSQVVALPPGGDQSKRNRLKGLGKAIANRYKALGHSATNHRLSTFYLLADLLDFFDLCFANQRRKALASLRDLKLLPFDADEVEAKLANFRQLSDEIRHNLSDILLAAMNLLYGGYKEAKSALRSPMRDNSSALHQHLTDLRRQARALITFAGLVPYRMPGDTNARLVRLEALMN